MRVLIVVFLLFSNICYSQIEVGTWQQYLSYKDIVELNEADGKIVAASYAGLFIVDMQENALTAYSKTNKLSDTGISAMNSTSDGDYIVIGYENGNIDVINDNKVYNIPALKNRDFNFSKTINSISINNNLAYCSTDFGIMVLDYINQRIEDTYYIGDDASNLMVYATAMCSDSIIAATEVGLKIACTSDNLNDYQLWSNAYIGNACTSLVNIGDSVLFSQVVSDSTSTVYSYNRGVVNATSTKDLKNFERLQKSEDMLFVICTDSLHIFSSDFSYRNTISKFSLEKGDVYPSFSAALSYDGELWFGDDNYGAVKYSTHISDSYLPDGPQSNNSSKVLSTGSRLYTVRGVKHMPITTNPPSYPAELSVYDDGKWTIQTRLTNSILINAYNLCDIVADPQNRNSVYIASSRAGIFHCSGSTIDKKYNESNSSVQNFLSFRIINCLAFDDDGNLFGSNQAAENPVVSMQKSSSDWFSYDYYPGIYVEDKPWIHELIHLSDGMFWGVQVYPETGLFLFNTNNNISNSTNHQYRSSLDYSGDERFQQLRIWDEDGYEINENPICIAKDNDDYVWVGTNSGVLVYYNPKSAFNEEYPRATKVLIPRNDGSDYADYLLDGTNVTAIAVDGANRKWFGTLGEGVFLVSEDGSETFQHFTSDNSPLLSDNINSISINPDNGEVYFATDKGIVSYKGASTGSTSSFNSVKCYPNPVRPTYSGDISIRGFKENSSVKITDVSGSLVYSAISTGGQVIWNGRNMRNQKVGTGVYLIHATDEEGKKGVVGKIMVVN